MLVTPLYAQEQDGNEGDDGVIELETGGDVEEGGDDEGAVDGDSPDAEEEEEEEANDEENEAAAKEEGADGEASKEEEADQPAPPLSDPYLDPPEPTDGERLAAQAEDAFVAGEYQRAIDLLQEAYDLEQNPNMLYNIARVHEETGDLERALQFYRQFVVAPNVDLDYRREALASSEMIEQALAAEQAAAEAQEPEESDQLPEQAVMLRPAPFPTTSPMRPVGFTLAAVGGAALLAGGIVGVVALNKEKDFRDAGSLSERRSTGAIARDLATTADALYISGAVLVVTGLVTAFASPRRERQLSRKLDVTIRNDGVGAAWTVRF